MLLERIYEEDLSQASYFIGCQARGEAIVIDPRRDIQVYLDLAKKNGMKISAVTETHIHADYLSGSRELASATGAELYLSDEGGPDWSYGFEGNRLKDGDSITIGNLTLQAVFTPGHTPEHMSYLLTDGAFTDRPGYMFTGDFVFAGDLGRPDLLDEAAGGHDTRFEGAKQLFASLRDKFLTLPDYVQVHPAHGAGSPCGKALGSVPSSTVGYERTFAWWAKYLETNDEQGFIDELLDGQPDAHAYFGRMKRENRDGPAVMGERAPLKRYTSAEAIAGQRDNEVIFLDPRALDDVRQGTVAGAINVAWNAKPSMYVGWAIDPERDKRDIVILTDEEEFAEDMRNRFVRVGVDNVTGFTSLSDELPAYLPELVQPEDLDGFEHDLLLDVRNNSEFRDGSIPGAQHISAGKVMWSLNELPKDGTIVAFCQSGVRSSVIASSLREAGFHVVELDGSYAAWSLRQQHA
ncbi:MBL fold metallo-hydrolase [Corynebacterium breve]|uniref:MBL fold metallo-hydrolase n=1 Tax=Corynebacterium breve TaxID=3049799 RepID=A0ABY8VG99_9CORY|nr:MBL fold metallo-hydrolase [Corynebacterium breve]WIM68132.1 MBL fold metallo-hydrolase [Corynebacterium breve]